MINVTLKPPSSEKSVDINIYLKGEQGMILAHKNLKVVQTPWSHTASCADWHEKGTPLNISISVDNEGCEGSFDVWVEKYRLEEDTEVWHGEYITSGDIPQSRQKEFNVPVDFIEDQEGFYFLRTYVIKHFQYDEDILVEEEWDRADMFISLLVDVSDP